MGILIEFKCKKCGYSEKGEFGLSGITGDFVAPFICKVRREIVLITGKCPALIPFSKIKMEGLPNHQKYPPVNPICPTCCDHSFEEMWDYSTCPRCETQNESIELGCWD